MYFRQVAALTWLIVAVTGLVAAVLPAGEATVSTTGLTNAQRATVAGLREVNYYPAGSGWTYMWTRFDPTQVDADFARLHTLGANTVRIIVQPDVVGYPTVKPAMARRLHTIFALAGQHDLRIHLTLFDWWSRYTDIAGSKQWVSSLLAPYRSNGRLSIVEVHNELDVTNADAVRWTRQIIPYVRTVVPSAMVTVSCASITPHQFSSFVTKLRGAHPSIWDYHFYGSPRFLYATLARIKAIAGSTPVIIGETGQTTSDTGGDTTALDQSQAAYYRVAFAATKALKLPDPAPWILSDFAPDAIPPSRTADDSRQYGYGLYRADGTPKPAAAVVSAAFHGPVRPSIDGGFGHESFTAGATVTGAWRLNLADAADFAVDQAVTRPSTASARISGSGGSLGNPPSFYATPTQPVVPGVRWTASAFVRGHAATGSTRVALAWYNAAHQLLGQSTSRMLPPGDSDWTALTAIGTAPTSARSVLVVLESCDNQGTAWFDDVRVAPAPTGPVHAS